MLVLGPVGHEATQVGIGTGRRAVGRVAEVDVGDDPVRDHICRDAALDRSDARDLGEREPADLDRARLDRREGPQPLERLVDRVLGRPWSRRVAADTAEGDAGVQVA
jgi:hypothetical protein